MRVYMGSARTGRVYRSMYSGNLEWVCAGRGCVRALLFVCTKYVCSGGGKL